MVSAARHFQLLRERYRMRRTSLRFLSICSTLRATPSLKLFPRWSRHVCRVPGSVRLRLFCAAVIGLVAAASVAGAQVNSVGQKPYLGWSSFSEQSIEPGFLTQSNVQSEFNSISILKAKFRLPDCAFKANARS